MDDIATLAVLALIGAAWLARDTISQSLPASGLDFSVTRSDLRSIFRTTATNNGLNPDWVDAIVKTESGYVLSKVNNKGKDQSLGKGAYGPSQILAINLSPIGKLPFTTTDVTTDAQKAADATCQLMLQGGPPATFEDTCAWWNDGKLTANDPNLANSTKTVYIPAAQKNLEWVQSNPVSGSPIAVADNSTDTTDNSSDTTSDTDTNSDDSSIA